MNTKSRIGRAKFSLVLLHLLLILSLVLGACSRPTPTPVPSGYEYDANGNLVRRTDANGATIKYEYDTENRLTRILYPDGSKVTYTYDALGRRTQMTDPLGTTTYAYDLYGRLVEVTDANGNQVGYEYDLADNLTTLIYPDGSVVRYGYDDQGRLANIQDSSGATTYTYDEAGQLVSRTLPNGVTTTYTYDADGRLTAILHTNAAGQTLLAFEYTLDANGNCTQIARISETGERQVARYEYDDLERLVGATYSDGRFERYTYDAAGNRLTMTTPEGETTYAYDQAGRLLSLTEPDGSVTTFAYDANGNLIERRSPKGTVRYTYDYENRLVRAGNETTAVEFAYDGDGNRVAKIVDGVRTEYVNHVNGLLPYVLLERSAGTEVHYMLGARLFAQTSAVTGETLYLLEDRLGSTIALAAADGTLAATFHYDAFGTVSPTGNVESPYGFTGEQYDPETGLIYLRARYYDPGLARFISKDPWLGSLVSPQSLNRYAYVENNPVNSTDPLGLQGGFPPRPRAPLYRTPWYPGIYWRELQKLGGLFGTQVTWWQPHVKFLATSLASALAPPIGLFVSSSDLYAAAYNRDWTGVAWSILGILAPNVAAKYRGEMWSTATDLVIGARSYLQDLSSDNDGIPDRIDPAPGDTNIPCGGVLLDKAAEMLVDLNDITGATYDPTTGQLILLGRQDRRLPPMSLDDLAVAIRAAYEPVGQKDGMLLFESPGVSIDPLDPKHPDVHHKEMAVSYFGHTEGTAFGQVLFGADRYLKTLGHGTDNLTGQPVDPDVPGYKTMLELWQTYPENPACPRWHRKWFFINQVRLKETADGRAMVFDESINPIRIEARFVKWVNGEKMDVSCADPAVDAFVQHFNDHYDEFAQAKPALLKLQQLARVAAVVQWIRENEIPLDMSWLSRYQIETVDTPTTTLALTTTLSTDSSQHWLYGGVDFELKKGENLIVEPDDRQAARMTQAALASRPSDMAIAWDVVIDGEPYQAVALTLAPIPIAGGYSTRQTDLTVPAPGGWPLALTRSYTSLDPLPGPLGYGWLLMPFSLHDQRSLRDSETGAPYDIYAQMVSADGRRVTFDVMRQWAPDPIVGFVSPPTRGGTGYLGIAYEVQVGQPRYRVWRQDRSQLIFDAQGRLIALADRDGNQITYRYDAEGRLEAAVGPGEQGSIRLEYDAQGRVERAIASTGQEVTYRYNDVGDLGEVTLAGGRRLTYTYDVAHRLASVALNGVSVLQNRYDDLGRLVEQADGEGHMVAAHHDRRSGEATWADPAGSSFHQTHDVAGRLLTRTDPLGHTTTYGYDDQGNLASVTDPRGNTTRWDHDEFHRLVAWTDASGQRYDILRVVDEAGNDVEYVRAPDGTAAEFVYDTQRRLIAVQEGYTEVERTAEGISFTFDPVLTRRTEFQYDPAGRLVGYQRFGRSQADEDVPVGPAVGFRYDDLGQVTAIQVGGRLVQERGYDALGRLASVSDPLGHRLNLTYDDAHRLTVVATATGQVRYTYDDLGRVTQVTGSLGQTTRYQYDGRGNLTQVTETNGAVTRYEYDSRGNLIHVVNAKGYEIHYVYDAMNRLVQVVEEGL